MPDLYGQKQWNETAASGVTNIGYADPDLEQMLRDKGYGDLVDANPWKNINYRQSGWQKFVGALGFRTGFDKNVENAQFQSNEYLSNIAALVQQNEYNSEQAKVDRMRGAGLNPDLQGIGDASESAGMPEDTNNILPNDPDDPTQVANFVMTGITTAMGLAGQIGQLSQLRTAVQSGKIGNARDILSFALDAVIGATPNEMPTDDEQYGNMVNSIFNNVTSSYAGVLGRRSQRDFKRAVSSIINGLPTSRDQYMAWRDRMSARQSAFRTASSDMYSETDDILYGISEILNKYSDRAYRKRNENDAAMADLQGTQIQNQQDYADVIDLGAVAGAENAAARQSAQASNFETDLNSVMAEITHFLKGKADKGSWMASAALVVFSLMRMMSVQRGTSSSIDSKGAVTNSSFFNFGF